MNVRNKYIVILLQITFYTFLYNYQLVTQNVSESRWVFWSESEWRVGSYQSLAWLYGALDWDRGGDVIPRSIQSMVLQQRQCCRQLHLAMVESNLFFLLLFHLNSYFMFGILILLMLFGIRYSYIFVNEFFLIFGICNISWTNTIWYSVFGNFSWTNIFDIRSNSLFVATLMEMRKRQ